MFVPLLKPHGLDCCSYVLKSCGMIVPILLRKIVCPSLAPLHFHVHFRIILSIFTKNISRDFDKDCIKALYQFGENRHLYHIESSNSSTLCLSLEGLK